MNETRKKPISKNFKKRNSKVKPTSSIDPEQLIRRSTTSKVVAHQPKWSYDTLDLHPSLKKNLASKGYIVPTPIQEKCIESAISGRDILGLASTGTGKTAAFLIPMIQQMLMGRQTIQSLIVVPTRELALQVEEEFTMLARGLNFRSISFIGGRSTQNDIKKLDSTYDVIIGTPGRLIDLHNQKALRLENITMFILDEFDRMLDMGFLNDVKKILSKLKSRKQTMFFSATMDTAQQRIIDEILTNPVFVKVEQQITASERVNQSIIRLSNGESKFEKLLSMIREEAFQKVLVFAETKRTVNQVGKMLAKHGVSSEMIHGNKSQNYRQHALKQFSDGKVQVLVATDVAARGLDVSDVSHVINYQMPRTMDSYIHRVGRTGRAGKSGHAFTFVD